MAESKKSGSKKSDTKRVSRKSSETDQPRDDREVTSAERGEHYAKAGDPDSDETVDPVDYHRGPGVELPKEDGSRRDMGDVKEERRKEAEKAEEKARKSQKSSSSSSDDPREGTRKDAERRLKEREKDESRPSRLDDRDPLLGWTAQQGGAKSPIRK